MPKYRRLSLHELEELEDSFITYLASNSITAAEWEKIQQQDPKRQEKLIDGFSDVVFEKSLHNINLLEQRTKKRILFYSFLEKEVNVLGLEIENSESIDLSSSFSIRDLYEHISKEEVKVQFIDGNKPYEKSKSEEVFQLLEENCLIVQDKTLFKFIADLKSKYAK